MTLEVLRGTPWVTVESPNYSRVFEYTSGSDGSPKYFKVL